MSRLATALLILAGAAACFNFSDGYFLSDDFVQLANFGHWTTVQFAEEVARRFVSSIDGANGFWRPLTYASFALNYVVAGAEPRAWLAVNLALHLANAVLVGVLVERLEGLDRARGRAAALFAGTLFFALASGWEVALWIAARYDAFATLFTLLAGWWFMKGRGHAALVAAALALMSKEAGSVALVLVGFLAIAREMDDPDASLKDIARRCAIQLWPFALLGLAYVLLRVALFGNATQAYSGAPVEVLSGAHWKELARSWWIWSEAVFPGAGVLRGLALAATAVLLAMGFLASPARATVTRLVAVLATLAATLLLLTPHLSQFDPSGIGGRLFYLPGALLATAAGIALGAALSAPRRALAASCATLAAFLVLAHLHWMWRAAREYHALHREMREVATGIAQESLRSLAPPALLLIPDALGRAPFGRNAQAGLMLPPVQRIPLSGRVLVQVDTEIERVPRKIERGLFDWLGKRPLYELPRATALDLPQGPARLEGTEPREPSGWFCWTAGRHRFNPMGVGSGDPATLVSRIEAAYTEAGCRSVPPVK
jgi:hypothetical protein